MAQQIKPKLLLALRYLLILAVFFFFLLPIYWVLISSFKFQIDLLTLPPDWLPVDFTLNAFQNIFTTKPIARWGLNSLAVSAGTTVLSLLLGIPAGYGFARLNFSGKRVILMLIIMTRAIPPIVLLLPFQVLMKFMGLLGTRMAVILIDTTYNVAFAVWLLSSFFESLPEALEEAALIDGCSWIRAFYHVALPLAKPSIVTVTIFSLIYSWNDFIFALVLTSPDTATLPVGILSTFGAMSVGWTQMLGMSVIAVVPIVLVSLWLQKYYIRGLTLGGFKQ